METRLASLEVANRRLTAAVVALAAFIVVGHVGGAMRRPGIVQATEFELVDQGGIERGNWTVSDNNAAILAMKNGEGDIRLIIAATSEMGAIHFFGHDEKHAGSIFGTDATKTIEKAERVNIGK